MPARTKSAKRRRASWRVIFALGAALGVGHTLETTGAAQSIADALIDTVHSTGPVGLLAGVYLLSMIFNLLIGAAGAAALVFPIARLAVLAEAAAGTPIDFTAFAVTIMVGCSASYASPIYQTNLMVYGPGDYKFGDYLRCGLPLNFIVMAVTVALAPIIWPLN
ncbi:MAG: SLC13 family permease [Planctomycetota bacterium]|nr:SLC13 family permease [Planctomycetota bacterium]